MKNSIKLTNKKKEDGFKLNQPLSISLISRAEAKKTSAFKFYVPQQPK